MVTVQPIEIEWMAWIIGPSENRRLLGAGALSVDMLADQIDSQIHADLEKTAALPAEVRNAYSLTEQYGFDAGTLANRVRALDPAGRAELLDAIEASA